MIKKLMMSFLLVYSFSVSAMISHKLMTVEEFGKQIEEDKKASLKAMREENAYAQALWDADLDRVKYFLQRASSAQEFRKINQEEQYIGKGAKYTKHIPLEIVYMSPADKNDKFAIYALLLEKGADANKNWRNQQLRWTDFAKDVEFAQWLRAHGAQ